MSMDQSTPTVSSRIVLFFRICSLHRLFSDFVAWAWAKKIDAHLAPFLPKWEKGEKTTSSGFLSLFSFPLLFVISLNFCLFSHRWKTIFPYAFLPWHKVVSSLSYTIISHLHLCCHFPFSWHRLLSTESNVPTSLSIWSVFPFSIHCISFLYSCILAFLYSCIIVFFYSKRDVILSFIIFVEFHVARCTLFFSSDYPSHLYPFSAFSITYFSRSLCISPLCVSCLP